MNPIQASPHSLSVQSDESLSLPEGKRYLKDYPDSRKTYDSEGKKTIVIDSAGYPLEVPDFMKDGLVLENPLDSELDQLARRCVLTVFSSRESVALDIEMAKFPADAAKAAVDRVSQERQVFFSPQQQEFAKVALQLIAARREVDQWWENNTHTGDDGKRYSNIPLSKWEVIKALGQDLLSIHSYLKKSHPLAVLSTKVTVTALALFFLHSLRCSFLRASSQPKLSTDSIRLKFKP